MFAFVNEVIDTIRLDALKERLHTLVEKRFRGELAKCQGCSLTPALSKGEGEGKRELTDSSNERVCTCKKKI